MNTFDLTLDLDKSAGVTQWVAIRQGDKSGTTIRATIYDHGTALSGNYTARICMRLPDGTHFYEKDATLSGNVATVTIDETQAASVSGLTHNAYFQIIQGSTVVASTQDFTVKVMRDAMSDAEVGENYSTQIEQAVESLENMTSTIPTKVVDEVDAQLAAHPEWTTTVQDGAVTDAKLIQSGGILDRVARLWHRLDNLLTATPAEADSLTVTDAAKTPLAGLALYGRSTQDGTPTPSAPVAIESVTPDESGNVSLWARGRNLAKNNGASVTTNGITYTLNADGSITANGTATANANAAFALSSRGNATALRLRDGAYTLSGCPAGGSSSTYELSLNTNPSGNVRMHDYGSGASYTFADGDGMLGCGMYIRIYSGQTVSGLTFRPMLEYGTAATPYQPYVESLTPIDLQGHALRSLPDGTRDEVTVDAYGHAVLTQRVGEIVLNGSENWSRSSTTNIVYMTLSGARLQSSVNNSMCSRFAVDTSSLSSMADPSFKLGMTSDHTRELLYVKSSEHATSAETFKAWLAENPTTVTYPLAMPVTIDLGTIDPVALQGPDMTAQSVPTAPFTLTYERDLNVTLARLEAAIAEVATS